jgi:hypothetical protein
MVKKPHFSIFAVATLKFKNNKQASNDAITGPSCCNRNDSFLNSWSLSILFFNSESYDKACKAI